MARPSNPAQNDHSILADYTGNISHCWRCSHCKWVPAPKSHSFAHACPSIQWGNFHPYSGGGKLITGYALQQGEAQYTDAAVESIFACTACGACDTSCKINNGEMVEPLEVIHAIRAQVVEDGKSLPQHLQMAENLRSEGNAAGFPRSSRSNWCASLGIKDAATQSIDVLLHIGCENAFQEALWPELQAIALLLNRAGVDFGILYNAESSTGEEAYDIGFQKEAKALAISMAKTFDTTNARRIVTCSASSYSGIRNIWPRLGVRSPTKELIHISEFVLQLVEMGKLSLPKKFSSKVTYHDSCKLGRLGESYTPTTTMRWEKVLNTMEVRENKQILFGNGGLYEPPRQLLRHLQDLELVEMERTRVSSYCCGAAGGAPEAYPEFAEFAAKKRLDEAEVTGASILVTAPGQCQCHMAKVAKDNNMRIQVKGLFEVLASGLATDNCGASK